MNDTSQNKVVGGVTLLLTIVLFLMLSVQCNATPSFDTITDKFSDLFEPNIQSVSVECFGDQGMGYWDGAANQPSAVLSSLPAPLVLKEALSGFATCCRRL